MSTQICVFNPTTGLIDVVTGVSSYSASPANAGLPVVLNTNGQLDESFTSNPVAATAAVNLAAGDLVNLYYNASGPQGAAIYAQLANAAHASSLPAHGFVIAAATAGTSISVFTEGLVSVPFTSGFTSSDTGTAIYLSNTTAGQVTKTPPTSPDLIQPLGFIYSVSTTVQFPFVPQPLVGASGGSVTSVGLSAPGIFTVSGSPVTSTGTLSFSLNTAAANAFFAGPTSGSAATPTFRAIVAADLPLATTGAFGAVKPDGTTITITSGVITAVGGAPSGSAGGDLSGTYPNPTVAKVNGGAVPISATLVGTNSSGQLVANATSYVTSVTLTVPARQTVTGSPVTSSGTLAITDNNQNANLVFSGPSTGAAATPTFRALVPADLPVATLSTLGVVQPDGSTITISGGVITAIGAAPSGVAGGDLSGSYPNPTVAKVNGAAVPISASYVGTNGSGQLVSATLPTATTSVLGLVKPDGTTITISGGVISSTGGGGSSLVMQVVTFSSTPTFDASTGPGFKIVLTGNVTSSTFTNGADQTTVTFRIHQNGTGGFTFAWPTNVRNGGTPSTSANARSVQLFAVDPTDGSLDALTPMAYS